MEEEPPPLLLTSPRLLARFSPMRVRVRGGAEGLQPPAAVSSQRQLPLCSRFLSSRLEAHSASLSLPISAYSRQFCQFACLSVLPPGSCLFPQLSPRSSHSNGSCGSASEEEVSRRANNTTNGQAPPPSETSRVEWRLTVVETSRAN